VTVPDYEGQAVDPPETTINGFQQKYGDWG
jgi:hypothetical protein